MEYVIDTLFVIIVFMNLILLGTIKIDLMIRLVAVQGMFLSVLPPLIQGPHGVSIVVAGITFFIKVIAIPSLLTKAMRGVRIKREDDPAIGSITSMLIGLIITGISFTLAAKHIPLASSSHPMIIPAGISMFATGVILLVSRIKALTQVIGYLVFDNAIFIFAMLLINTIPLMVEMGILLDLLVCIFGMGILIHAISEHFSTIDTRKMNYLKG